MELELFLHILGAMVLVGSLVLAAVAVAGSRRDGSGAAGLRLAYRALLLGALPGWIVMRVMAQLLAGDIPSGAEPTFIEIGYSVAEPGLVLLLGAALACWLGARRGEGGSPVSTRIAGGLIAISLVAYVVVIWAMTTQPV